MVGAAKVVKLPARSVWLAGWLAKTGGPEGGLAGGTASKAPMSTPLPRGRGEFSKSVVGAWLARPLSMARLPASRR